jgi:hypothetical protein
MTTEHWTSQLSAYVDGELSAADQQACEAHLAWSGDCRETVEALRAIVADASALPPDQLDRDLWPGILAAIEDPAVLPLRPRRRPWYAGAWQLAAAAALVAMVSGGSVWLAMRHGAVEPVPPATSVSAAPPAMAQVAPAAARAEQTYDAAVVDLRRVLDAGRGRLDSTTVRVLERNLAIIDAAVADARRAVESDPNNAYLNAYLARTMRRKVDLLRQAATLVRAET